jgi:hypothetical protein
MESCQLEFHLNCHAAGAVANLISFSTIALYLIPASYLQIQKLHDEYVGEVERLRKIKDTELREHKD